MLKMGNFVLSKIRGRWKALLSLLMGGAALGGIVWGLGVVYPLEATELRTRASLWFSHVREVQLETSSQSLHAYLKNGCNSKPGPDCVCVALIHGLGDNALTWKRMLEFPTGIWNSMGLARPLLLLALDLPGSGQSALPKSQEEYRVRNQAKTVIQALRPLCNRWTVVGNSLGGWIAAWIGLEWPEGTERLVLLAPAGFKGSTSGAHSLVEPTVESMKEFQKNAYFRPRPIPEEIWLEIVRKVRGGNSRQVAEAQIEEDNLETRFPALRAPTLMIWGKEDRIIPIGIGMQMRETRHATLWRETPECGHLPQKECPIPVLQGIVDMTNYGSM